MPKLPLNIKQISTIANRLNRIGTAELMRREVIDPGPAAMLGQVLPHSPRGQAAPHATGAGYEQRIEAGWQGKQGAGFKPAFNVFGGLLVKDNDPIIMGFPAPYEGGSVALFDKYILDSQGGQFANPQAGIQRQRPERQRPHVKPGTFALIGYGFKVVKELFKLCVAWRSGQQPGAWGLFGQVNGVVIQLAPLDQPGKENLEGFIVGVNGAFFQAALFTVKQESVDGFGGWGPATAGVGAELVERRFVIQDRLGRFARLCLQEQMHVIGQGREARLHKVNTGMGHSDSFC